MALSDVKVRTAKPEAKAYKLTDGEGMVLLVHPNVLLRAQANVVIGHHIAADDGDIFTTDIHRAG
ncbi:integrase [Yersinia frederiksenii]|nr:integrase [Yersinia frederiksenii]